MNPDEVEKKLVELEQQIKQLTDHLLFTREQVILKNESLPFLQYQIKRLLFEDTAKNKLLYEIQDELGLTWNSFQTAKRKESRMSENLNFMNKYLDVALKNLEALKSEKEKLETANKLLQEQLHAKDQIIAGYEKLASEITNIMEKRRVPSEVVEEIKKILETEAPPLKQKIGEEEIEEGV